MKNLILAAVAGATLSATTSSALADATYLSPTDYFSQATAEAPTKTLPGDYDYISPIPDVSTGKIAAPTADITNPITTYDGAAGPSGGNASARADRASGELHAAAGALSGTQFGADAYALFGDTLQFTTLGANTGTVTTVGFNVHVDGSFTPLDSMASGCAGAAGCGNGEVLFTLGNQEYSGGFVTGFTPTTSNIVTTGSVDQNWAGGPQDINENFSGTFSYSGPDASAAIFMLLFAQGQYGYFNFGETATFSFDPLPTGVSYTSASGDFLTAVPELSTWAMMLLGFAGLGFANYHQTGHKRSARA
jgi:hypothetical protein